MPTVGIVGLGFGRAYIPAFKANECEVIAVCQRDQATAVKVAERYGVRSVFARWEDMLQREKPDIVAIATPPSLHAAIATQALAAGAHVLCEKPLAMTSAEADAMVTAANRAGQIAMTDFNWRFPVAMRELHARAQRGDIGRVFHLSARWLGGRWADETTVPTWRMDRTQAGYGAMGDAGVHLIDMIRWSFGEFARVSADAGIAYPSRTVPGGGRRADAEDYCTVLAELASGAKAVLTVSRVARGANEHTLEVYGTNGAFRYRLDRDTTHWWTGELWAARDGSFQRVEVQEPSELPDGDPLEIIGTTLIAPLVARMLKGIKKGETPSPSFTDGARAQSVLDAVLQSLVRRSWVDVR